MINRKPKWAANFIWSMYLLIMLRHLVPKTFTILHATTLHYTCRLFTSFHLNFTQVHFTALVFSLTPFKFVFRTHIDITIGKEIRALFMYIWYTRRYGSCLYLLFQVTVIILTALSVQQYSNVCVEFGPFVNHVSIRRH